MSADAEGEVDPYSRLFSAVGNPTIVSRAEGKGQRAKERVEVRRYKGIGDTLIGRKATSDTEILEPPNSDLSFALLPSALCP
jgi:hypothetical protein